METPSEKLTGVISAWPLALVALGLALLVFVGGDVRTDNLLYGVLKVAVLGYVGHWIYRWTFPESLPHMRDGIARGAAERNKALIIAASIIAGTLIP